jgi:hypothetical protein
MISTVATGRAEKGRRPKFTRLILYMLSNILFQCTDIRESLRHIALLHGQQYFFRLPAQALFDNFNIPHQLDGVAAADIV